METYLSPQGISHLAVDKPPNLGRGEGHTKPRRNLLSELRVCIPCKQLDALARGASAVANSG